MVVALLDDEERRRNQNPNTSAESAPIAIAKIKMGRYLARCSRGTVTIASIEPAPDDAIGGAGGPELRERRSGGSTLVGAILSDGRSEGAAGCVARLPMEGRSTGGSDTHPVRACSRA